MRFQLVSALCVSLSGLVCFTTAQQQSPNIPAGELVRRVIRHELQAEDEDHSHWRYRLYREEPGKSEVREVIETANGDVDILLARNGHPLTPEERQKQIEHLERLATDPADLRERRSDQREDAEKAQQLLKIVPDAFLFDYARTEGERVWLSFRPNPSFQPSSREATVFHAMVGTLELDTREQRLAGIEGQLFQEVKFGGGVLGHLDKGGTFKVVQSEVAPGFWELTTLDVEITGKALLFKTINLQQKERRTNYRRVPDDLTVAQALEQLLELLRAGGPVPAAYRRGGTACHMSCGLVSQAPPATGQ